MLRASVTAEEGAVEDYVKKIIKEKNVKEEKDATYVEFLFC